MSKSCRGLCILVGIGSAVLAYIANKVMYCLCTKFLRKNASKKIRWDSKISFPRTLTGSQGMCVENFFGIGSVVFESIQVNGNPY